MTKEYKYRPPLKYLFTGLGGLSSSILFGMVIGADEIWFSIIVGFFCLMTLVVGIGFLTMFFWKIRGGNLKVGVNFIEIPGRWQDRIRIDFSDIIDIGEIDTYDNVIEIESEAGIHLIERNWMSQRDFENVKNKLKKYWINKADYPQ